MAKALKYVAPLAKPLLGVAMPDYVVELEKELEFTEALAEKLPETEEKKNAEFSFEVAEDAFMKRREGSHLRVLKELLDKVGAAPRYGGLNPIHTPEGQILWLCDRHAAKYRL